MNTAYETAVASLSEADRQRLEKALARLGWDSDWRFTVIPEATWIATYGDSGFWRNDPAARMTTIRAPRSTPQVSDSNPSLDTSKSFQTSTLSEQQRRVDDYLAHHQKQHREPTAKKTCGYMRVPNQESSELALIAKWEHRSMSSQAAKILYEFAHRYEASVGGIYSVDWKFNRPGKVIRPYLDKETWALLRAKKPRWMTMSKYTAKIIQQYLIESSGLIGANPRRYENRFYEQRTKRRCQRRGATVRVEGRAVFQHNRD